MDPPVPPPELVSLRATVDTALDDLLDELASRLTELHRDAAPLAAEVRRFAAGGKRLRPVLLLVGHTIAGGEADDVLGPALALELVHTCALLHDDLIDAATDRRGQPAAHVAFAQRHVDAGWHGDPDRYGTSAALLLGDLSHVWADEVFDRADVDADALSAARARFATMREEVTVGQYLDVTTAMTRRGGTDRALEVADLKSARYSVARPLEVGALLAGAPDLADGLFRFGVPLGEAFQLRDDVLGVFGDETTTGKSAVSDLAEGKRTWLVAATFERLPEDDRAAMDELLGDPDLGPDGADAIRRSMVGSGGLAATERRIAVLVEVALGRLDELPLDGDARRLLGAIASYLVERTR